MNTVELAKLLLEKKRWSYRELGKECGLTSSAVHKAISRPCKFGRLGGFHLGVLSVAFKNGFEAEVLSIILGDEKGSVEIANILRVASIFPDLQPDELAEIHKVEKASNSTQLSREIIENIISGLRSRKKLEKEGSKR